MKEWFGHKSQKWMKERVCSSGFNFWNLFRYLGNIDKVILKVRREFWIVAGFCHHIF